MLADNLMIGNIDTIDKAIKALKENVLVLNIILDSKKLGLKLEPTGNANKPWEIVCFSDSNYACDLVSRRSIGSFILYVLCVPVSWQSKAQKSVTLSSSEAEWVTLS